jgi:ubiquitin C-terminal hydrolase
MKVDAQKRIESAKAAQVFNSLSLPWDDLLLVLNESAEITDVRLSSIVANSQECRVNVIGNARYCNSILAFVQEFKELMTVLQGTLRINLIDDQGRDGALRLIRFGFNFTL